MNEQRTIQVQGVSKLNCKPDIVGLSFEISSKQELYLKAYEMVNKTVKLLRETFNKAGFGEILIKTSNITVSRQTKRKYTGNEYEDVFDGFKAVHSLFIEIDNDKNLINTVLAIIIKSSLVQDLNIYYKIKDVAPYRYEAISEAVKQAKHNAGIIAEASGVTLGRILNIGYGWSEIRIREEAMQLDCEMLQIQDFSLAPDIEADDMKIGESVTIVYSIAD